jgi:hypothetical protein
MTPLGVNQRRTELNQNGIIINGKVKAKYANNLKIQNPAYEQVTVLES